MTTLPLVPRILKATDQIASHYRDAIRSGRLTAGDEIPANRRLAEEWGVSTATALRATNLLREEGWISTRPGRRPVVRGIP